VAFPQEREGEIAIVASMVKKISSTIHTIKSFVMNSGLTNYNLFQFLTTSEKIHTILFFE
jgi:hypothetical protein